MAMERSNRASSFQRGSPYSPEVMSRNAMIQNQQFVIHHPPYDFQWAWVDYYGNPYLHEAYANAGSGQMGCHSNCGLFTSSGCGVNGAAALGLFLHPDGPSTLQVWSSPQFYYSWDIEATIGTCSSSASLGLYLARFALDGQFVGEPLGGPNDTLTDHQWYQTITYSIGGAKDAGFLQEAIYKEYLVDDNHNYILWLWCSGSSTADGRWPSFGFIQGSNAYSFIDLTVPWISTNLQPLIL